MFAQKQYVILHKDIVRTLCNMHNLKND